MKLQLYYPVKPIFVTQKFGETANLAYYQANGVNFAGHNGIDFMAKHGQPIYATHDGTAYYEIDQDQGHGVVLITNQQFDYLDGQAFYKSIYWHMCDSTKEPQFKSPVEGTGNSGLKISAGDLLGYADTTGLSMGDHLHFGLKPVANNEPAYTWSNIEQNNGYQGAIDPSPYFNGLYACDIKSPVFTHFDIDMQYRDTGPEIVRLQSFLSQLGYFYGNTYPNYGDITRASVFNFQKDHVKLSPWEYFVLKGSKVGPKTRQELNAIIDYKSNQ